MVIKVGISFALGPLFFFFPDFVLNACATGVGRAYASLEVAGSLVGLKSLIIAFGGF